jgi:hypothetical protein
VHGQRASRDKQTSRQTKQAGLLHLDLRAGCTASGQVGSGEGLEVSVVVVTLGLEPQTAILARLTRVAFPLIQLQVLHGVSSGAST